MTAYLASGVKFVGFLVDFPFILACKWVTFLPCTRNKLTEHRGDRMGESLDLLCLTEHRGEINKWFWNSVNVKMPCVLLRKKNVFACASRASFGFSSTSDFLSGEGRGLFSKSNQNVLFLQKSRKHGLRLPLMMSA